MEPKNLPLLIQLEYRKVKTDEQRRSQQSQIDCIINTHAQETHFFVSFPHRDWLNEKSFSTLCFLFYTIQSVSAPFVRIVFESLQAQI